MIDPDAALPEEVHWQGDYIAAKQRGKWEYVGRARGIGAAVIVAVDDGHVLLVEQFRMPLLRLCLELPAGLVGDVEEGEDVLASAARELEEETGYRPGRVELIGDFASSPGMVSETFSLVRALDLTQVGAGGGVPGENITVRRVPLAEIADFVAARRAAGLMIDAKILLLLGAGILAG
ncbi:NUDIX hydrolase [Sphingomonas abietis]|uniref:GDP-mannose pyrophosphatase n=1 Tax=Sphingomonas abietis TaxID=3012344 RepID=A0ABY7NVD7_9SPHN|nr:NUDIX hydrolase [Sphingomonas abietis]WBO24532.1 NUDIX hydrolase [Sphingomonas abietis]